VKKLVELGADISMTSSLGESAVDFAMKANKNEVVEFLSSLTENNISSSQVGNESFGFGF
jgi:ankyrin repeat protein